MIAGGLGYSLAELALLPPLPVYPSGIASLDSLTRGGLAPGAVWTVSGPPSIGVSTLALSVARNAGGAASVAVANDHLQAHVLRDRLRGADEHIEVASWIPLPDCRDDDGSDWFGTPYDVLIIDCFDEMLRPNAWPKGEDAIRQGRWLRELARRSDTAVVLTARTERPPSVGWRALERAWHGHWACPVFDDVADLRVELWPESGGGSRFHASARGYGQVAGTAHYCARRLTLSED